MPKGLGSNFGKFGKNYDRKNPISLDIKFDQDQDANWDEIGLVHTRPCSAIQRNSNGALVFAPENRIANSENLAALLTNNTSAGGGATVEAASSITDPFGGNAAYKIKEAASSAGNIYHTKFHTVTGLKTGEQYICSIYARAGETHGLFLESHGASTSKDHARFGLGGDKGRQGGGAGAATKSGYIERINNDWYRLSIVTVAASNQIHFGVRVLRQYSVVGNESTGDGNTGLYLFGMQIERCIKRTGVNSQNTHVFMPDYHKPSAYKKTTGTAYYGPRFDYDIDGNAKGLLIEQESTNLITHSQKVIAGTGWSATNITTDANATEAPTGEKEASRIKTTTASGLHIIGPASTPSIPASTNFTYSVYLKKDSTDYAKIYHNDSNSMMLQVDLNKGKITNTGSINGRSFIEDAGNGWYRVGYNHKTPSTHAVGSMFIYPTDVNGTINHSGNEWSIFAWGVQVELGGAASSLIPTFGATATRSTDVVKITGDNFTKFFNPNQGTVVFEGSVIKGLKEDSVYNRLFEFHNGSNNNDRILAYLNNSQVAVGSLRSGGTTQISAGGTNSKTTSGDVFNFSLTYGENYFKPNADQRNSTTTTSLTLPTGINTLNIGTDRPNAKGLNGWVKKFTYHKRKRSEDWNQQSTKNLNVLSEVRGGLSALSLRNVSGKPKQKVVRVRRGLDDIEQDFTALQVADGSLASFCKFNTDTLPLNKALPVAELVTNGDFSSATGWTLSGATISGGKLNFANSVFDTAKPAGLKGDNVSNYRMSFTVDSISGALLFIWPGGFFNPTITSAGSYVYESTSPSSNEFIMANNGGPIVIDDFSVKKITADGNEVAGMGVSTRKISSATLDPAMIVRRADDNIEAIVNYDSNGVISANSSIANPSYNLVPNSKDMEDWDNDETPQIGQNYRIEDGVTDAFGTNTAQRLHTTSYSNSIPRQRVAIEKGEDYTLTAYVEKKTISGGYAPTILLYPYDINKVQPVYNTYGHNSSVAGFFIDVTNGRVGYIGNGNSAQWLKLAIKEENGFYKVTAHFKDPLFPSTKDGYMVLTPKLDSAANLYTTGTFGGAPAGARDLAWHSFQVEKTQYGTLSEEKLTNGDFSSDTIWFKSSAFSIANGKANFSGSSTGKISQKCHFNRARTYQLTFTVSDSSSTARIFIGNHDGNKSYNPLQSGYSNFANGTHTVDLKVTNSNEGLLDSSNANGVPRDLAIWGHSDNGSFKLDNVSLKEKQVEIVTNGSFAADSDWTKAADWTISGGKANLNTTTTGRTLAQNSIGQGGGSYEVTYTVSNYVAGDVRIKLGNAYGETRNANGTYTDIITPIIPMEGTESGVTWTDRAAEVANLHFENVTATTNLSIDNVSMKERIEIPRAYQETPTTPNGNVPFGGVTDAPNSDAGDTDASTLGGFLNKENLFLNSEDFTDGIWLKSNVLVEKSDITDPFDGYNSYLITSDANGIGAILQDNLTTTDDKYVVSVYLKKGTMDTVQFGLVDQGSASVRAEVNLTDGTISSSAGSPTEMTITPVGSDGWFRCSLAYTLPAGGSDTFQLRSGSTSKSGENFYAFGYQVNTGSLKDYQKTTGTALTGNIHVVQWIGQGGIRGFVQDTASLQPRLAAGGELVKDSNGIQSVDFNSQRMTSENDLKDYTRLDTFMHLETSDEQWILFSDSSSTDKYGFTVQNGDTSNNSTADAQNYGYNHLFFVDNKQTTGNTRNEMHDRLSGKPHVLSVKNAATIGWGDVSIGKWDVSSDWDFKGKISEIVMYGNVVPDDSRSEVTYEMLQAKGINLVDSDFSTSDGFTLAASGSSSLTIGGGKANFNVVSDGYLKLHTGTSFSSLPFVDGVNYKLTAKVNGESGKQMRFRDTTGNNGGLTTSNGIVTFTGADQDVELTFTANTNSIELAAERHSNGTYNFTIDEVKLETLSSDGFVVKLYDQSGNKADAVQATKNYQPVVVENGVVVNSNGYPAWKYPEGNPQKSITVENVHGLTEPALAFVLDAGTDTNYLFPNGSVGGASGKYGNGALDGDTGANQSNYGDALVYVNGSQINSPNRQTFYDAIEGGVKLLYNHSASTTGWATFKLGHYMSDNQTWNLSGGFKIMEMIVIDEESIGGRRSFIESNLNNHYHIY